MALRPGYFFLFFLLLATAAFAQNTDSAIHAIRQIKNDTGQLKALDRYAESLEREYPRSALSVYEGLEKTAEEKEQKYYTAGAFFGMGHVIYQYLQDYTHGLQYLLQALALQKGLKLYKEEINTYFSIAYLYDYTGDLDKEKSYAGEARAIAEQYKLYDMQPSVLNLLATIDTKQMKLDTAIKMYRQAIDLTKAQKDTAEEISCSANLATALKRDKQYDAALAIFDETLKLVDTATNFYAYGMMTGEMAFLYYDMGDLQQSERYALKSIALEPKADEIDILEEMYKLLRDIYTDEKKYPQALDYFSKWTVINDSIINIGKTLQLKELETKYGIRVKNEQISAQNKQIANEKKINFFLALVSLLVIAMGAMIYRNQRNTAQLNKLITTQKKEVENINEVKDRIFSVISHDMRSPVHTLISFTELLEQGDIPAEELTTYAHTLKHNLGYTAGLMDNLLNWAKTQMHGYKPVQEHFDIAGIVQNVVGLMEGDANRKGVKISNEVAHNTFVLADVNMTALIIRNLLSNAIKYTFNNGSIAISARKDNGKVNVLIKDTGKGMTADMVAAFNSEHEAQPLNSTPGTENEKGTGLGLMLCKNFALLMGGSITVESEPGKGSCFMITLPQHN